MIDDNGTYISYTCTGGELAFPYPFTIFEASDLYVYRNGVLQALSVNYTVSNPIGPGNVVPIFVPTAGDIVLIIRLVPFERLCSW